LFTHSTVQNRTNGNKAENDDKLIFFHTFTSKQSSLSYIFFCNVLLCLCPAGLLNVKIDIKTTFLFTVLTGREKVFYNFRDVFLGNMMKSFFMGNWEIKLPIVQGGMGVGISLSGLASAVANEGGIGVISCAGLGLIHMRHDDFLQNCIWGLKEELRLVREKTKGIIGVNIMVALSNFADMARTAIAEKVDVIFSGAGLPLDLPSFRTSGSKTKLVPIVSSARAAKIICDKWHSNYKYLPDAVVVEGPKAGGHLGFKREQIDDKSYSLEKIVPDVVKVLAAYKGIKTIPVIAAGGISSGGDIHRFIEMGASAVQMGTIFVTTDECDASEAFKQVYITAREGDLQIISSPVGMPGRAIKSEFLKRVALGLEVPNNCPIHCIRTCDYSKSPYCIMKALFNAAKGNMKKGYAFAGVNAHLAQKLSSVKEVIEILKIEFAMAESGAVASLTKLLIKKRLSV
jgi:NAD(P)H-dependent flavin oxidoreductase YrpB (nitropropane dioxygenase family)